MSDVTKFISANGRFPAVAMPAEFGMHSFVVHWDYTGTRP
jgi:hypothetical protein